MSEFLSHLILRSAGASKSSEETRILQPRLPSLYEAAGGSTELPTPEGEDALPSEITPGLSPNRQRREDPPHTSFPGQEGNPVRSHPPVTDREDSRESPPGRAHTPAFPVRAAVDGGEQADKASRQVVPEVQASGKDGTPAVITPALHASDRSLPRGKDDPDEHGMDISSALHPQVHLHPSDRAGSPPLRREEGSSGVSSESAEGRGSDSWGNPPLVRISIGRIEVKAYPAAPVHPPRTPASSRPKLTLDEYLRQRNEGKR